MKDCKEFYYNEDSTWTIVYQDETKSVVKQLPIEFDYIGISLFLCFVHGAEYAKSCHWSFVKDGALCPIAQNNKWGFVNSLFQIVIEPSFDFESGFKTTYFNADGELVPDYTTYGICWENGKCRVLLNGNEIVLKERDYFRSNNDCLIETKTNYAYKLKYMVNPTFDKVRDLAVSFYRELPQELQDELYVALNRGIDILDSEPQMTAYLFSFGKMHQAKLEYAFSKLPEEFLEQPEINIIDYGCGQALGTMCYSDFLCEKGYLQKIKSITLIEPSEICLKRAALHASTFFPDTEIKTVNKKFDDLTQDDIICSEETPTLHILSNVLDMTCFDLGKFSDLIKVCTKGSNQFVCVGPYFNESPFDSRIMDFSCSFYVDYYMESLDKRKLNANKDWTCSLSVFFYGEPLYNEDKYGVIYSKDGKSLLKCKNKEITSYIIKKGTQIICDNAFSDCTSLQKIKIPNSVTTIGDHSFYCCFAIKQIRLPDSVIEIKEGAFCHCQSLQEINIPSSVTCISDYTFECCELVKIEIPDSVTCIGHSAFASNPLKQIAIPNMVKCIGDWAFAGCALEQVSIPNSVTSIGEFTFSGNSLEQITIPNSVTSIGEYAFAGCGLGQIIIPNSVTTISERAFWCCRSLRQIVLPKSMSLIPSKCFYGCYGLRTVVVNNPELYISNDAFENCYNLDTFIIPDGLSFYPGRLFNYERRDHDYYHEDITVRKLSQFDDSNQLLIEKETSRLFLYYGDAPSVNIPDHVTEIRDGAFSNCINLESVYIPDSVTSIGSDAFSNCASLKKINLPSSITFIGENAFEYCGSLQQVEIPNSIKTISKWFSCCGLLERIIIPDGVTSLEAHCFEHCWGLKTVDIPKTVTSIEMCAFRNCESLQQITIPDSVEVIDYNAFENCSTLQHVVLSESLTAIEGSTFANCKMLQSIVIPKSVKSIGDGAFRGCESLQSIVISDTVTKIGSSAFSGCYSLKQLFIPNSVAEIGLGAFSNCSSLERISIPDTVNVMNCAFLGCNSLKQIDSQRFTFKNNMLIDTKNHVLLLYMGKESIVTIPNLVTRIDQKAFSKCTSLKKVIFSDSVEGIPWRAFEGCSSLVEIVVPSTILYIDSLAFDDCKSFKQITIPKGSRSRFESFDVIGDIDLWDKLVEE